MDLGKGMRATKSGSIFSRRIFARQPRFFFDHAEVGPAGSIFDLNILHPHSLPTGETFGSLGGLAIFIKSYLFRWPDNFRRASFLVFGHIGNHQHQAPRGPRGKRGPVMNPVLIQKAHHLHRHGFKGG